MEVATRVQRDLFVYLTVVSVSFNVCVLLYGCTRRALVVKVWWCRSRTHPQLQCPPTNHFTRGARNKDISQVVSSVATGVLISVLSFTSLLTTNVINTPFVYIGDIHFLLVICSSIVGRYLYLLATSVYLHHIRPRDRYITLLHHGAALACYVTATVSGSNLLLPLLGVFMEMDQYIKDILQLMRRRTSDACSNTTLKIVTVFGLLSAVCFRAVLPIAGLTIALITQSPFSLDTGSLGVLCFSVLFFMVFNVCTIRHWVICVMKSRVVTGTPLYRGVSTDCNAENSIICTDQKEIRNDLRSSKKNSPSGTFTVKDVKLLGRLSKADNIHTATNLLSNFSNQTQSKETSSMARMGGLKAAEEGILQSDEMVTFSDQPLGATYS